MSYRLRIERLREAASAKGDESGYAISKRTGLAESTVSRLLRGQAKPGAKTLLLLCQHYGRSVEDLVETTAP